MSDAASGNEKNVLSSARRVLDGLRVIALARGPVALSTLASTLGVSEVAAYRVARTLISAGYVRPAASGAAGYELTWQIVEMSTALLERTDLRNAAQGPLSRLADEYGESITVAIPDGDHVVFIDKINANRSVHCDVGKRLPLHVGAASRAILANAPERSAKAHLARNLVAYTAATQTDPEVIREDLVLVRELGYAVSVGDVEVGISAVAAPILNARSEILGAAAIANISAK